MEPKGTPRVDRSGALITLLVLCALVGACGLSFARPLFGVPTLALVIGIATALVVRSVRRQAAEVARRVVEWNAVAPPEGRAWRVLLAHLGHGRFVEALATDARWALRPHDAEGAVRSQFGGEPLLPRGHQWPAHAGKPLAFVGQLDLAELRAAFARFDAYRADPHERWVGPPEGLLSFFVSDALWEHPADLATARVSFFPAHAELVATRLPEKLEAHHRYRARPVGFVAYESPRREAIPVDEEEALEALAQIQSYLDRDRTHVLGHADIVQHPMEETCERIARGLSLTETLHGALAEEVRGAATRWQLLLQVGEPTEDMAWGDAGLLHFWITGEDLAAGRFDGVVALLEQL